MLFGIEDAMHATGLGRSKLYELMESGAIESVKCGKRRLIPIEALEAFVAGLRASSRATAA